MDAACGTCRFWVHAATIEGTTGQCRRYPTPQPTTAPDHWCGEYQPATAETAPASE